MRFEDIWASDFGLDGRESLPEAEGASLAALFSSGRTEPSRVFTGLDGERSAMADCTCCLVQGRAIETREWKERWI